jgi:hypothetical protein
MMLTRLLRERLANWLDDGRPREMLAKALLSARRSLDPTTAAITNPAYDFAKDRSRYPTFAAQFTKIDRVNTHPHYAWGVLQGVSLAKALNLERVSVIEFGVAGGRGLIALERIAASVQNTYGVAIDVYGFDAGSGLPSVADHRDLPNLWSEGYYPMDREKLQHHLQKAHLLLGDVQDTVPQFLKAKPAPVAFVSFDLDLYTSTTAALSIFDAEYCALLPRVHCYFDDINGFTAGEHNGERLAIHEFNESHVMRKISHTYGLKYFIPEPYAREMWVDMIFLAHIFDHPLYGRNDGLVRGSESADPLDTRPHWTRMARMILAFLG